MNVEEYINIIKYKLKNNIKNINLVSSTSNLVFKVENFNNENVYVKFYLNKSSHIDNELLLYDKVNNIYLKEVLYLSNDPKMAIFKELKGTTIDKLLPEKLEKNKEKIINSLIDFFESISKTKIDGYGILDSNLKGSSKSFKEFIILRQTKTR